MYDILKSFLPYLFLELGRYIIARSFGSPCIGQYPINALILFSVRKIGLDSFWILSFSHHWPSWYLQSTCPFPGEAFPLWDSHHWGRWSGQQMSGKIIQHRRSGNPNSGRKSHTHWMSQHRGEISEAGRNVRRAFEYLRGWNLWLLICISRARPFIQWSLYMIDSSFMCVTGEVYHIHK